VDRFERSSSGGRGSEGVEMLGDAELVAVEAVDPEWLRAYFVLIDHDASIRDSSKEGESPSADVRKRRLTVAADALKAMRAVPLASDTEPVAGRRSGAGPRASTKFRHRIEIQIERSILTEAKSLGVTLPASFMPTKLPPTASDAKSWFAEAKTLAQFLSLASRAWNGDAEDLDVEYLAIDGHGRTRTELADLETIRATWSEARYSRVRAATVGVK
jgi:hypothetical protein